MTTTRDAILKVAAAYADVPYEQVAAGVGSLNRDALDRTLDLMASSDVPVSASATDAEVIEAMAAYVSGGGGGGSDPHGNIKQFAVAGATNGKSVTVRFGLDSFEDTSTLQGMVTLNNNTGSVSSISLSAGMKVAVAIQNASFVGFKSGNTDIPYTVTDGMYCFEMPSSFTNTFTIG